MMEECTVVDVCQQFGSCIYRKASGFVATVLPYRKRFGRAFTAADLNLRLPEADDEYGSRSSL
jgi:hypothetical protein